MSQTTNEISNRRARALGQVFFRGVRHAALLVGASSMMFAGCGDDTSGGGTPDEEPARKLSIVQWVHFVPQYDRWFDPFVKAWAAENNVELTLEHVPISEVNGRVADAIAAGQGPDLLEVLSPPSALEPDVMDLTDVNAQAVALYGTQHDVCTKSSWNPSTNVFHGFAHGWIPDPGNYRQSLWEVAGVDLPNGPLTWAELRTGGKTIKDTTNPSVPLGIGMVHEIDSNMGARALMWSYGASVQDENENVVINSQATKDAVQFMIDLYNDTMTDVVLQDTWTAGSNNTELINGNVSYILNSISAYRSAQKVNPAIADDVFLVPPLKGPGGIGFASSHVIPIYIIPKYSENAEVAKEFLLHLVNNYNNAVFNSELYNFPCWEETTPQLLEADGWLDQDPFGSRPLTKMNVLKTAGSWTTNVGHPGPANAAIGEVFTSYVLPDMFKEAVEGSKTVDLAVADAEARINDIFQKWRDAGLVGGG